MLKAFLKALRICMIVSKFYGSLRYQGPQALLVQASVPHLNRYRDFPAHSGWESACQYRGHWVQSLDREDSTCLRATKHMYHNLWACTLGSASCNCWAHVPREPVHCNERSRHRKKPAHHSEEQPLLAATRERPRATMNSQCNQKIIINKCSNRWINKSWQEYSLKHKRLNLVKMVFIPFPLSLLLQVAIYNTAYCWTLGYAILSDTDTFWLLPGLFLLHFFL